ncbi:hypothetical protein [Peterkaempfera bronchialis]|uniref:hypothetical protein n=1 Tax=Peterkaempfera bronchialis TaxID=2126346 RepID=UPI00158CC28E|nr:hypothetical protein [Peterkaempfera bronchialis]
MVDSWRQSEAVQTAYAEGVEGYLSGFATALSAQTARNGRPLTEQEARDRAVRMLSELVGAMVLARAVRHADTALSDTFLHTCRTRLAQEAAHPGVSHP